MLKVKQLTVVRAGRRILDRINLEIKPGDIRLLVGASGSGKTTLLRSIAGLEVPDEGTIELGGEQVSGPGSAFVPPHRRKLAMAFQDGALWSHLTVEQHLRFGHTSDRGGDSAGKDIAYKMLELIGLDDRRTERPVHMSGGERQRLGLARALAMQPAIILLDEPLAHIDLPAQRELAGRLVNYLQGCGTTVLWVTHRPGEIRFMNAAISVLSEDGTVKHIPADQAQSWLSEVGR